MQSLKIMWLGPKFKNKCYDKKHTDKKEKGHVKTEVESGVGQPQQNGTWSHD